jgi:hypothetical protein
LIKEKEEEKQIVVAAGEGAKTKL